MREVVSISSIIVSGTGQSGVSRRGDVSLACCTVVWACDYWIVNLQMLRRRNWNVKDFCYNCYAGYDMLDITRESQTERV